MRKIIQSLLLTICVILLISGSSLPLLATTHQNISFHPTSQPHLRRPASVQVSNAGTVAVWDSGLQSFRFFAVRDTAVEPVDLLSRTENVESHFLASALEQFNLTNQVGGFWDQAGRFWFYDEYLKLAGETFPVTRFTARGTRARIPGAVRKIYPVGDNWIVQPDTGPLYRLDPYAPEKNIDTSPYSLKGTLIEIIEAGRMYTRAGDTIYAYDGNKLLYQRTMDGVVEVCLRGDNLYVLEEKGRLLKLDLELNLDYVFDFRQNHQLSDFTIYDRKAIFAGSRGIYLVSLKNGTGSFFSSSRTVRLNKIFPVSPEINEQKFQRIWAEKADGLEDTRTIYLNTGGKQAARLSWAGEKFSLREEAVPSDNLPLSAFQYFQFQHSYWSPAGRLYYFFPEERSVEVYSRQNKILRKVALQWGRFGRLRDLKFVGADKQRIIISGEFLFPDRGARRVLAVFNERGEFQRLLKLGASLNYPDWFSETAPTIRYGGDGMLYVLHSTYIQRYDLNGYPRGIIGSVDHPRDLLPVGDKLLVLDWNGWRLKELPRKEVPRVRYGSPPGQLAVKEAVNVGPEKSVLVARKPEAAVSSLYEYRSDRRSYQKALSHPEKSLRYPFQADAGDTLFFWARRPDREKSELFYCDLDRYQARELNVEAKPRGPGNYLDEKSLFLIPVNGSGENSSKHYRYYKRNGDTRGKLVDSDNLLWLQEKEFKGFYGVRGNDTGYSLVTGYISRESETAPLGWTRDRTLLTTEHPVTQLIRGNNSVYLSLKKPVGAEIIKVNINTQNGTPSVQTETVYRGAGELSWLNSGQKTRRILQKQPRGAGRLLELYGTEQSPRGGIRGRLASEDPLDLGDIPLLVQPGGRLTETGSNGTFRFNNLPAGYLQIYPITYKFYFAHPFFEVIPGGNYTINHRILLQSPTEVPLLKKGFTSFNEGKFSEARPRLEVFRNMLGEGPYYRAAGVILAEIFRVTGDFEALFNYFRKAEDTFTFRELLELYLEVDKPARKLELLEQLRRQVPPEFEEFIKYQQFVLYFKRNLGATGSSPPGPPPVLNDFWTDDR